MEIRQQRSNRVLWLSALTVIAIAILYIGLLYLLRRIPPAGEFIGHAFGVIGFVLMLMTEILYSLRKRSRSARWGRMAGWLDFHIFTGIVGPFLVILHTSWKFNGLAGWVTLLTLIVAASGFIGRYIYTAVPRTVDGVELEAGELEAQISAGEAEIQSRLGARPELKQSDRAIHDPAIRAQLEHLDALQKRQDSLKRQVASLAAARRLLALWHSIHIPIGMALFTAAFIHITAAIYYVTLSR